MTLKVVNQSHPYEPHRQAHPDFGHANTHPPHTVYVGGILVLLNYLIFDEPTPFLYPETWRNIGCKFPI